jgi:hypothetical protein
MLVCVQSDSFAAQDRQFIFWRFARTCKFERSPPLM